MERTPKNIDDLFRERLYAAAPPPPAFVWDNVERELRKRNRRKLFFWLFFTGIAGAGISGLWFASETGQQHNTVHIVPQQPIIQSAAIDEKTVAANTSAHANSQIDTENGAIENSSQQSKVLPIYDSRVIKTTAPTHKGQASLTTNKRVSNLNKTPNTTKETTTVPQPQKTIIEVGQAEAGFSLAKLPQHPLLLPVHSQTILPSDDNALQQTWPSMLKPVKSKAKAKKAVKNCYDFSKQPNAWIIDAHVGPTLAQREMTANPDDKPYLVKRLSTEERNLAFNAGLRATLMLKGNFLVRAGVQYEQMTEVFEFIDPDYVKYHVEITTQNGMTTIDTVGVDYGERYQKTYNRFGMVDIPLSAGIELRKGRSGFNINAGVSFNMLFWKRGAIIAPNVGEPAWFTPKDGTLEVFRPRTGMSAMASIQWFYHVTPRLRVFVEPYYKKIMRPVTLNSHPVEQRYGLGGLRLGVSKILN